MGARRSKTIDLKNFSVPLGARQEKMERNNDRLYFFRVFLHVIPVIFMSTSDVNQSTFLAEVLEKSHQTPVVVDFFATWCGPCQMLKPLLEKLVPEYGLVLAKVDIDENPGLAQEYGVSGVPDVRIVVDGLVQPGFVGMLPEPKLREMLQRLKLKSGLNASLDRLYALAESGDIVAAEIQIQALLTEHPNDPGLILEAGNFYLESGNLEMAETLAGRIPQHEKELAARARGLQALIEFKRAIGSEVMSELDQQYKDAAQASLEQRYEEALSGFLAIVERDRLYRNDAARRSMLALFDLLGNENPLTNVYRKKLMTAIY